MSAKFLAIHPVLPVRDVRAAVRYYEERLGFTRAFQDSEEDPRYAGLRRDRIEIHVQWHDPAAFDRVEKLNLRFLIDDVDALFEEYRDKQVFHARTALRNTPWHTREFAFYDPDGNGLTFYRDL